MRRSRGVLSSRHDSSERLIGSQGFLPSIPIQQILTPDLYLLVFAARNHSPPNVSVLTRDSMRPGMQGSTEVHAEVSSRPWLAPQHICRVCVRIRVQSHAHIRHDPRLPPSPSSSFHRKWEVQPQRNLLGGRPSHRASSENPQCTSYANIRHDRSRPHRCPSYAHIRHDPRLPPSPSKSLENGKVHTIIPRRPRQIRRAGAKVGRDGRHGRSISRAMRGSFELWIAAANARANVGRDRRQGLAR